MMNRRAFLRSTTATAASLLACRGWGGEEKKAKLSDQEILEQASSGIEEHRKGAGTISVQDERGKPVKGAKIRLQQLRHEFLFGCNLFAFARIGNPDLEERYRSHFAAMFNYCTLGFYWAAYEPERGKPHYDYTDKAVEWTGEHGIVCKGHPLAWDHPVSAPRWLPDDPAEIERLSTGRVREIVSRYGRRIDIWDVVNEATHLDNDPHKSKMADWAKSCGAVQYVAKHLRAARAANPKATLLVNDYRTDPPYYRILEALRGMEKSPGSFGLFDTIGVQSHMHGGIWPLSRFGRFARSISGSVCRSTLRKQQLSAAREQKVEPGAHHPHKTKRSKRNKPSDSIRRYFRIRRCGRSRGGISRTLGLGKARLPDGCEKICPPNRSMSNSSH
jgi:hypothetical protein